MKRKNGSAAKSAGGRRMRSERIENTVEEISFEIGRGSLGPVLVAFSEKGIVSILMGDDADQLLADLEQRFPNAHLTSGGRTDKKLTQQVIAHIEDPARPLDMTLDFRGTAFQKRVWRAVREIPPGQTLSYAEVSQKIGAPMAMRAVGTSCAMNLLAFVVPCHRVVRSDGSFAQGHLRMLLERERKLGFGERPPAVRKKKPRR